MESSVLVVLHLGPEVASPLYLGKSVFDSYAALLLLGCQLPQHPPRFVCQDCLDWILMPLGDWRHSQPSAQRGQPPMLTHALPNLSCWYQQSPRMICSQHLIQRPPPDSSFDTSCNPLERQWTDVSLQNGRQHRRLLASPFHPAHVVGRLHDTSSSFDCYVPLPDTMAT